MIRHLPLRPKSRSPRWRRVFVPVAVLDLVGRGRSLVVCRIVQTRWSRSQHRRLWRVSGSEPVTASTIAVITPRSKSND